MAVSILRALDGMDLDLDRNIYQVLRQLCSFLTDVYQYWDAKVSKNKTQNCNFTKFRITGDGSFWA